jgi:hypothetical protein
MSPFRFNATKYASFDSFVRLAIANVSGGSSRQHVHFSMTLVSPGEPYEKVFSTYALVAYPPHLGRTCIQNGPQNAACRSRTEEQQCKGPSLTHQINSCHVSFLEVNGALQD